MSYSTEELSCNWLELPRDVMARIFSRLGPIEILSSVQLVCSQWWSICNEPSLWRTINVHNKGDLWEMEKDAEVMCRRAIDRSCGRLADINIEYFGSDELLDYITASCTQIKRLRLVYCYEVSNEGLCETAAKLPLLEDLELSLCPFLSFRALEGMGHHCRRLKSLKLNKPGYQPPVEEEDHDALTIAKTMPELRQLQLVGNKLTNAGLEAILNGCPHLESLDLRWSFNVDLTGELGRRCALRIRDLRRPLDSTHDYEFDTPLSDEHIHPTPEMSEDEFYGGGMISEDEFYVGGMISEDEFYEGGMISEDDL